MTTTQIETAYNRFCEIMGFNLGTWNSVFEFSILVGYPILKTEKSPTEIQYPPETINKVEMFLSPNANTLLKAYKIRRYSWANRLRAPVVKARNILIFAGYSFRAFFRGGLY
jgi:hypothetical protein